MEPPERGLSDIDRFCLETREAGKIEAAQRVRFVASALGTLCAVLIVGLGFSVWRAEAVERERDALVAELHSERAARLEATLAAKDVERSVASYALDTDVRSDIVRERMLAQERRSAELAQLAQKVERQKLVEADCVTPRSIISAAGL